MLPKMHIPLVVFLWVLSAVFAYPLRHGATTDVQVLAFANVLEQLESVFYTQALEQLNASSFRTAGFTSSQIPIQQIQAIASDENTHAITLQSAIHALGGQVVSNCTFNFSSALASVDSMIATARLFENVGVSAYLGALASLVDPGLVTTAGSILSVEARHQSTLNLLSGTTNIPQPFDVPLTPEDVLAIADTFTSGCKLDFTANSLLIVTNTGPLQAGTKLNFSSPALNRTTSTNQLSCKIVTGGLSTPLYQPMDNCMVPTNVTGPMYVFITDDEMTTKLSPNAVGTNSSIVVAGPVLLFVNKPDLIGNSIRPGPNVTGGPTLASIVPTTTPSLAAAETTYTLSGHMHTYTAPAHIPSLGVFTTTISPAQASALLSSLIN